jgi:hypothetical protein
MSSPYWQCPACHSVSRKNDETLRIVNDTGPSAILSGVVRCPDCGAHFDLDTVYVAGAYDISIEDFYGGKFGRRLIANVRRAADAGKIRLSPEETELLHAAQTGRSEATPGSGCLSAIAPIAWHIVALR